MRERSDERRTRSTIRAGRLDLEGPGDRPAASPTRPRRGIERNGGGRLRRRASSHAPSLARSVTVGHYGPCGGAERTYPDRDTRDLLHGPQLSSQRFREGANEASSAAALLWSTAGRHRRGDAGACVPAGATNWTYRRRGAIRGPRARARAVASADRDTRARMIAPPSRSGDDHDAAALAE